MKLPRSWLVSFPWLVVVCALAGCSRPTPSGPTEQEKKLRSEVAALKLQLDEMTSSSAQAKQESEAIIALLKAKLAEAKATLESQAAAAATADAASSSESVRDTAYLVVNKKLTPGQLLPVAVGAPLSATKRIPAKFEVFFKGVPSGKEYPVVDVRESAYGGFIVGQSYPAQAIIDARQPPVPPGSTPPVKAPNDGVTVLSEEAARAIFGN